MTRNLALRFGLGLLSHAASERYPTRSVEYLLASLMLVWSFSCALPGAMFAGPATVYFAAVMPEVYWGVAGMTVAILRVLALVRNGSYAQSPTLRFIGAMVGFNWWLALYVLYTTAVSLGEASDFPMRRCFLVFVLFEAYSCFRCGQDSAAMKSKREADRLALKPAGRAGNG